MNQYKKLPNPSNKHWFLGNIWELLKDPLYYVSKSREEVGDIFALQSPFGKFMAIANPKYIKYILQDNNKNYYKGMAYNNAKPLLGEGLLTSEGDFWRQQRRLAQPAFYKTRLENLFEIMKSTVQELIEDWKKKYKDGDTINISTEMNRLALMIVANALFQSDVKAEMEIISESLDKAMERTVERIKKPWTLPLWIPTTENLREQKVIHILKEVIRKIIAERKASNQSYEDLLDMLLHAQDEESGSQMTEKQLLDEVMTIFLAGHETTANALGYALFLLNENQEANQKLFTEGKDFLATQALDFANSRNLTYTKLVIQETLRMCPPAWMISRSSIAPDKIGEYEIDAKTNIVINIFAMHHLEEFWETPNVFMPERFESDRFKNMPKFVYFPFGGGPRLCIGEQFAMLEMILALTLINQAFYFENIEGYTLELMPLVTLRPKENIKLKIYHRKE